VVQELSHPCHQKDAEDGEGDISEKEDAAADKADARLVNDKRIFPRGYGEIRNQKHREDDIGDHDIEILFFVLCHFADIGDVINEYEKQKAVKNPSQPVGENQMMAMGGKCIETHIGPGSAEDQTDHRQEEFGTSGFADIRKNNQNNDHKADCRDDDVRCRRIVCKMNMLHLFTCFHYKKISLRGIN
ncbi:MAG: hypothetical protein IJ973_04480, partial [Christensenellaceae bacterium]|nr:hypothetical protein [Christensenellaceae bacterium]